MVRSSLGRALLDSGSGLSAAEYPMYAISVPDFLELSAWAPHQDLLASGKVKEMKAGEDEVLFCSHQWTSFTHPDPTNEQLHALQAQIRKLSLGKTRVASNPMLDAVYQYPMLTTGEEWAKKLPHMHLWIDYMSIPQPGAVGSTHSDATHADHRQSTSDDARVAELVEQLKAAVNSIPSYIERSSMMWVVVPPVKHSNLQDAICDFSSWRRRGWCRMEFAASKLACGDDMPLMVIMNADEPPQYFNPCDMFKLCAAKGDFTVDSDRAEVNKTLTKMLEAKADSYRTRNGDITLMRLMKVFSPVFVPREAYGSSINDPSLMEGASSESSALARLKNFFGWRGDEAEAAWQQETGWNLITLAAAMDNEAALDELLDARSPEEKKRDVNAIGAKIVIPGNAVKKGPLHRREPLGQKLLQYSEGMTPLMAAMTLASPGVVEKLIAAGADVERDGLRLLGERPCTFRGAVIAGKSENVKLLLSRYPQYANQANEMGTCALHFCAQSSQCRGQKATMQVLLDAGADPCAAVGVFNGSVLSTACNTYDQDPEAIRLLLDAGADPSKKEVLLGKTVFIRRLAGCMRCLTGSTMMRGLHNMLKVLPAAFKQTPLHVAAKRGDVQLVKVLAEHKAIVDAAKATDKKGRTPTILAQVTWGSEVEGAMVKAIGEKNPEAAAAAAAAAQAAPQKSRKRSVFGSRQISPVG